MNELNRGLRDAGRTLAHLDGLDVGAAVGAIDALDERQLRFVVLRAWLDAHRELAAEAGWQPDDAEVQAA